MKRMLKRKRPVRQPISFYPTSGIGVWYSDGYLDGANGSATSGGYTVSDSFENITTGTIDRPGGLTNNEAELIACLEGLKLASNGDELVVDSTTIISWLNNFKKSSPRQDLLHLVEETRELLHKKKINLYWRPRDENLAGIYNDSRNN
jgi:ribonuclease HI